MFVEPLIRIRMLPVPPGDFLMGSREGERDEQNVTRVTISRPFWLGETEVTQRAWRAVLVRIPAHFVADYEQPVEQVSWAEAAGFCRILTEHARAQGLLPAGYVYRLPTEAEWEYACRAGSAGAYAGKAKAMAWFERNSGNATHVVAQKKPNAWGFFDMHGNVWEWCADWYAPAHPGGAATDPRGPRLGEMRVRKGGSWWEPLDFCTSSFRGRSPPDEQAFHIGFRIALAPELPEGP